MKNIKLLFTLIFIGLGVSSLKAQDFTEIIKVGASDQAAGDNFGYAVSISGTRAIVGAHNNDDGASGAGSAYIFDLIGGTWTETQKLVASDPDLNDNFGFSVSISGDRAIVSSYRDDEVGSNSGSVYVFELSGGTWTETEKLTASDAAADDAFGYSVSLSGDRAVIGAFQDDDAGAASGSAYVFDFSAGIWTETQKLTASDANLGDRFGRDVTLSGDVLLIGADLNDDAGSASGSAYVFELTGGVWAETQKLTASDAAAGDNFGFSLSMTADRAIIGAFRNDDAGSNAGSAYIFDLSGGTWTETQKLTAADAAADDNFGRDVFLSDDRVVIGAFQNADEGATTGSAYIFEVDGGTWSETQKLTASDAAAGDAFGFAVGISGNNLIIGAYGNDDIGSNSGSAYFFEAELACTDVTGTDVITACDSLVWIDGITYTEDDFVSTFNIVGGAASGCDSLVTLNLTINNSVTGTDVITACDSLVWIDGITYTEDDFVSTFNIVGGAASGCDSLVTLNLTINNSVTGTDVITACDSLVWIDGITYTEDDFVSTFNIVGGAATGCDSLVTLNLTINSSATGTDVQTACDSYTWIDGITYTEDDFVSTFNIVGGAASGCDSLVTLNLTINNSATGTDVQTACYSYTWIDGITYTEDNDIATFNIVGGAVTGCDSLVTLNLTINSVDITVTNTDPTLTSEATGATYVWLDCNDDFAVILGETEQSFTSLENGDYAVQVTQDGCVDTSACFAIVTVGIDEYNVLFNNVLIFPNPVSGSNQVNISLGDLTDVYINVINVSGQIVYQTNLTNTTTHTFELNEEAGIYFIQVSSEGQTQTYKLIKM